MKTTIVYTVLVLAAATLFSCRKEYSVENGNGLPADFTAQINGSHVGCRGQQPICLYRAGGHHDRWYEFRWAAADHFTQ
jgi:hypothetical protein